MLEAANVCNIRIYMLKQQAIIKKIDEVWYVPQQEELNREYYRVMHNLPTSKVKPVPFVWDPVFIRSSM